MIAKIQEDEVYLAGRIVSFFSFFIFLYLLVRFNVGWDIKGNILLVCFAFTRSTPFFHDFFSEKVEDFKNSYYFLCLHLIESIGFNFLFASIISDFFNKFMNEEWFLFFYFNFYIFIIFSFSIFLIYELLENKINNLKKVCIL